MMCSVGGQATKRLGDFVRAVEIEHETTAHCRPVR